MVKLTHTHTICATVWRTQNKSVCRRCQPQEITLLNPSGKPLFTVSSTEKTDKIRIPSAYPLRRRQCNCGEFYLVSKLAASTTGSIWRYPTDILYSAVAMANKINAKLLVESSQLFHITPVHFNIRWLILNMLMLMTVNCWLAWGHSSTGRKQDGWWKYGKTWQTWGGGKQSQCKSIRKTQPNKQHRVRCDKTWK